MGKSIAPKVPKTPLAARVLYCASCHQRTLHQDLTKRRPWWTCSNLLCPAKQRAARTVAGVQVTGR